MGDNVIPQFVPYWDRSEIDAVSDILENSNYLNEHKTVREFERAFAESVGARYCVAVTSGTVALYCAIMATSMRGKVKVPSHDGIFVFNSLLSAGATPLVSDVNQQGLLDLSVTDGTESGIVVHANGRIAPIIHDIEDCAQAITHHTKDCISTYSFASTKHITTAGQGGAICCDSKDVFDALVRLKDHGRNDRQSLKPMSDNYDTWGMNFKMTEVQAAFGLAQLRTLPARMSRLQQIFSIYQDVLGDKVYFDDEAPKWYVDIFTPHAPKIVEQLKKKKIYCRLYPRPLHLQKVASSYVDGSEFENTERRHRRGLYLPSTTNISDEDVMYVAQEVVHAIP